MMEDTTVASFTAIGAHQPSDNFFRLLGHFFPDPEAGPEAENRNLFLRYIKEEEASFKRNLRKVVKELRSPYRRGVDVTVVIEDGALCADHIDKVFQASGLKGRAFVGLFNCYSFTILGRDHAVGHNNLALPFLFAVDEPDHVVSSGNVTTDLNGTIIHSFFNRWQRNDPALVQKQADSTFIPIFRYDLCYVFGQQMIPTFVMELADSHSVESLLTAVVSWLCGTLLLIETVLAVDLWKKALTIDVWKFDCTVNHIEHLISLNVYRDRDLQSLRMVAKYKARRWLIDLRLVLFLIDRENDRLTALQEGRPLQGDRQLVAHHQECIFADIPQDVQTLFQDANAVIGEDFRAIQELAGANGHDFTLRPQNGLMVPSVETLLNHGPQIGDEIEYYQHIVDNIGALGGPSETELVDVSLDSAILRVAKILPRNSETPITLGPVTSNFVAEHDLQLNVPQKSLTGYGIAPVTVPNDSVSRWVRLFHWGGLGECFVQGKGIGWNLVPDRDRLVHDREARGLPYNESRPTINNGWIELKHLTLPGLRAVYDWQEVHGRLPAVPKDLRVDSIFFRWAILRRSQPGKRSLVEILELRNVRAAEV